MTRKAKVGIAILAFAVATPPAVWVALRKRIPIEFIGEKPDVTFIFPEEFKGKPMIDWKAPGGLQITFPKKRKLAGGAVSSAVAGYLDFPLPPKSTFLSSFGLKVGSEFSSMPIAFLQEPVTPSSPPRPAGVTAISGVSFVTFSTPAGLGHPIYGVPYATDESNRVAEISQGATKYKLKLPVSHDFGPSIRRTEVLAAGKWKVTAKPHPWLFTTQDIVFDLTTDAPKGTMLIFRPKWKNQGTERWLYGQDQPYLLDKQSVPMYTSRYQSSGDFEGSIVELESFKVKVRAVREKRDLRLYSMDGQLLYMLGTAQGRGKHKLEMLDCRGKRLVFGGYQTYRNGDRYTFPNIRNGEVIDAIAYRAKTNYPVSASLDLPKPLEAPTQIVGTGSSRYHYYYWRP